MFAINETTPDLSHLLSMLATKSRVGFGDVQRLRRVLVANGVAGRSEVERLVALDGRIGRKDPAWTTALVASIVDFLIWVERPTGAIGEDAARWLVATLTGPNGASAETIRLVLSEIAEEAQVFENDALAILASADAARTPRPRPIPAALAA